MTTSKAISQQDREAGDVENVHLSKDVAVRFLANLDPVVKDVPISAKEARKVLWEIDLIVLPIIAGTVILSAVDKVGHCTRSLLSKLTCSQVVISNAAIMGMKHDLKLVGKDILG